MESPILMQKKKKLECSLTGLCGGQLLSGMALFLVLITLLPFILACQYWFPLLRHLCQPLLAHLPAPLGRNFMFLLCNLILVVLSGDKNHQSLFMFKSFKPRRDIYDEYVTRKSEITETKMRNSEEDRDSHVAKMSYMEMNEEEEEEDIHEGEENQEQGAEEMNRMFAEFIARMREKMRSEELLSGRE